VVNKLGNKMAQIDFGIIKPELAGSFGAGFRASQQEREARETNALNLKIKKEELDAFQQDRQKLLEFRDEMAKVGKNGNPRQISRVFLSSGIPDQMKLGAELLKGAEEHDRLARALGEPTSDELFATAPSAPVAPAMPGTLGSGTFGMTPEPMAAPANALMPTPAPANALMPTPAPAKRALTTEDKINNLIRGGFAEEARVLQAQQTALNRKDNIPTSVAEYERSLTDPGYMRFLQERAAAMRAPRAERAPRTQVTTLADGSIALVNLDTGKIVPTSMDGQPVQAKGTSDAKVSEQQASYNVSRILSAANQIANVSSKNESVDKPGVLEAAAESVGLAGTANLARSGPRQVVYGAQRDALDAMLYLATGAAYNKEQLAGQTAAYIPAFTDTKDAIEAKRQRWIDLIEAAKIRSGKSWTPKLEQSLQQIIPILSSSSGEKPAAQGAPAKPAATGNLSPAEQAELDQLLDQLRKRFGK